MTVAVAETPFSVSTQLPVRPVVAGVSGKKKFIYDMWGDTVYVAFRLSADAPAATVQVDDFILEPAGRGTIVRLLGDDRPRTLARATAFGAASLALRASTRPLSPLP